MTIWSGTYEPVATIAKSGQVPMRLRPLLLREFSAVIVVSIVAKILRSQESMGKRRLRGQLVLYVIGPKKPRIA